MYQFSGSFLGFEGDFPERDNREFKHPDQGFNTLNQAICVTADYRSN